MLTICKCSQTHPMCLDCCVMLCSSPQDANGTESVAETAVAAACCIHQNLQLLHDAVAAGWQHPACMAYGTLVMVVSVSSMFAGTVPAQYIFGQSYGHSSDENPCHAQIWLLLSCLTCQTLTWSTACLSCCCPSWLHAPCHSSLPGPTALCQLARAPLKLKLKSKHCGWHTMYIVLGK